MAGPLSQISMFDLPAPEEQPKQDATHAPNEAALPGQPAARPELQPLPEAGQLDFPEQQVTTNAPTPAFEEVENFDYPLYPTLPEPEPFMAAEPEPLMPVPQPETTIEVPATDAPTQDVVEAVFFEPEALAEPEVAAQETEMPAAEAEQQPAKETETSPVTFEAGEIAIPEAVSFVEEESTKAPSVTDAQAESAPVAEIHPEPADIEASIPVIVPAQTPEAVTPEVEQTEAAQETVSFFEPSVESPVQPQAEIPETEAHTEGETSTEEAPAAPEPVVATAPEPVPQPSVPEPAPQPVAQSSGRPYLAFDIEVVETNEADIPREFLSGRPMTPQGPKVKSTRGRKSIKATEAGPDKILVPEDEELFKKQYYPISEVAVMFGVNISQIRYWENEFPQLKPRKNGKGDRLFRPEDVKMLVLIHDLIRRRKYTLEGAKDYLKLNNGEDMRFPLIQQLQKLKGFLNELKANM